MSSQILIPQFDDFSIEEDPNFELPEGHKFTRTPEELQELMGKASYEFSYSSRKLQEMQASISIRIPQVRIILLSRSVHLIQSLPLRDHLLKMFEDPKFKWTNDILDSCIFVEQRELLTKRDIWEGIKKRAEKEFEQWSRQLGYYQSKMRQDIEEMKFSGVGKGA